MQVTGQPTISLIFTIFVLLFLTPINISNLKQTIIRSFSMGIKNSVVSAFNTTILFTTYT